MSSPIRGEQVGVAGDETFDCSLPFDDIRPGGRCKISFLMPLENTKSSHEEHDADGRQKHRR